jgi:thioredoxin-related protein
VNFKGKKFTNSNYNEKLINRRNSTHDFARYLGVSGYPTVVFFDKDSNPIAPITGYLNPNQIEIYLNLFSNEAYNDIKSQEDFKKFMDNFESKFKI